MSRGPVHKVRLAADESTRAMKAYQRKQVLQINCDACGTVLHRTTVREFQVRPTVHQLLGRQGLEKHKAETGCSGEKPPADAVAVTAGEALEAGELVTVVDDKAYRVDPPGTILAPVAPGDVTEAP